MFSVRTAQMLVLAPALAAFLASITLTLWLGLADANKHQLTSIDSYIGTILFLSMIGALIAMIANAVFGVAWRSWARGMRWEYWLFDALAGSLVAAGIFWVMIGESVRWAVDNSADPMGSFLPLFTWSLAIGAMTGIVARHFAAANPPTPAP